MNHSDHPIIPGQIFFGASRRTDSVTGFFGASAEQTTMTFQTPEVQQASHGEKEESPVQDVTSC